MNRLSQNPGFGILLLRIFVGFRLLYGVVDNIFSWNKMIEFSTFLETFEFPFPTISAVLSVYAQFFAAVFIIFGFKIRFVSSLMVFNFLIALLFVHIAAEDSVEAMTPALAILFICLTLMFTGAGEFSLDHFFQIKLKDRVNLKERLKAPSLDKSLRKKRNLRM